MYHCMDMYMGASDDEVIVPKIGVECTSSSASSASSASAFEAGMDGFMGPTAADDMWSYSFPLSVPVGQGAAVDGEAGVMSHRDFMSAHEWTAQAPFPDETDVVDDRGRVADMTVEDFQVLHELLLGCDSYGDKASSLGARLREVEGVRGKRSVDMTDLVHASTR